MNKLEQAFMSICVIGLSVIILTLPIVMYVTIQEKLAETELMKVTTLQIVQQNKELGIQQ